MKCNLSIFSMVTIVVFLIAAPSYCDEPYAIPERVQILAKDFPISERLNIDWAHAKTNDIGRYIGFLSAVSVIGEEIAKENGRDLPIDADYISALAGLCIFPPNKPPMVEKYWPIQEPAYFDAKVRMALREAVGPLLIGLPMAMTGNGQAALILEEKAFPTEEDQYFDEVLDLKNIPGFQ